MKDMGFLFEVMEMFWNYTVLMVVQHCEHIKRLKCTLFKMVKTHAPETNVALCCVSTRLHQKQTNKQINKMVKIHRNRVELWLSRVGEMRKCWSKDTNFQL